MLSYLIKIVLAGENDLEVLVELQRRKYEFDDCEKQATILLITFWNFTMF